MKASLIIFGMIFLVIGGLLYFVPMQEVRADATTIGNGDVDVYASSASVTVPIGWAYASGIVGFVLLVLGLANSNSNPIIVNEAKNDSYDKVVESKENVEVGEGNGRKIYRVRTEKHKTRS